ncbi:ABC transporter permease [Pseudomonas cichorii]|uniref:ABC transporter permease n=1 Tax=Pseudomonas cichorii TaxID=36746 RepID=UPI0018E5F28C|nr:ABC transporter permease [Pseudomonas cichorii]MBI6855173.1 ABC transporter permease [Pseudomonas cichorii]
MSEERFAHYGPSTGQIFLEPLNSLRLLGRRSLLALLGIAVGCASVVALLNIGQNAANEAISAFKGLGSDMLVVSFAAVPGMKMRPAPATLDVPAVMEAVPGVLHVAPVMMLSTRVSFDGRTHNTNIAGTSSDLAAVLGLRVAQGRFLSGYDSRSTYAVLGAQVARELGLESLQDMAGRRVQIDGYLFEVVGILSGHGQNPLIPVSVDDAVFVPIEGMRRISSKPEITNVIARGGGGETLEQDGNALSSYLQTLAPGRDVQVQIPQQLLDGLAQQSRTFSYLLAGLGGISLLVGGVGVMNVMVMNVSERRREIGVRMALGARPVDIGRLFLLEAAVLSIAGATIGACLGLLAAWLFSVVSGWGFTLSLPSLPLGIVSSLLVGLFFGLNPALMAARLEPVQALRDD